MVIKKGVLTSRKPESGDPINQSLASLLPSEAISDVTSYDNKEDVTMFSTAITTST